jgi:hypothetical protein
MKELEISPTDGLAGRGGDGTARGFGGSLKLKANGAINVTTAITANGGTGLFG